MTPAKSAKKASKKSAKKSAGKSAAKKAAKAKAPAADERRLFGPKDVSRMIQDLGDAILAEFSSPQGLILMGVRTRGVVLAERLRDHLEKAYKTSIGLGILDITLYRDDLSALGPQPMVRDSEIPFDITGGNIILVDDVLYTGRTVRAAMDEVIDFGRPNLIRLAVLIDRGCREYPIQADYVGKIVETTYDQSVRVYFKETDDRDEVVMRNGE